MTITERVRQRLRILHSDIADFIKSIKPGACPTGKVNRIINSIEDGISKLSKLPLVFEAAAIAQKLGPADREVVVRRASEARDKLTRFLKSLETMLSTVPEKGCDTVMIQTIGMYMVMSSSAVESRIKHLTDELEEAEVIITVPAIAERIF